MSLIPPSFAVRFAEELSQFVRFVLGLRMNVIQTPPVEIALRTLGDEDRRRVLAWFDHLANWENDPVVQSRSQKLPSADNVYVLKTSSEFRIFFRIEKDRIVILDIATRATILSSGHTSTTGQ